MNRAQPFIKWAGGKRQILSAIRERLPTKMGAYFEPFVGGGAVFFLLDSQNAFESAVIGDMNRELLLAYRGLAEPSILEKTISLLKNYSYDHEFYLAMRKKEVSKDFSMSEDEFAETTARFIYLNRTGFNGLYRVNKKGGFNVPFGRYTNPTLCDEANLRLVSSALGQSRVTILHDDFETQVESASVGDIVYFDPPYYPRSATSNFTGYLAGGFGLEEQKRLAICFRRLADKGVGVLLSNSDTPTVYNLYEGFQIDVIEARRSINSKGTGRGPVPEVLIQANLR